MPRPAWASQTIPRSTAGLDADVAACLRRGDYLAAGILLLQAGDADGAYDAYTRAWRLDRAAPNLLSSMILCYDLLPFATWRGAADLRQRWVESHAPREQPLAIRDPDPDRPLRVGLASADFKAHSAAVCFSGLIFYHSPAIELYCYSDTPRTPGTQTITDVIESSTKWRDMRDRSDADWRQQVMTDKIDVLIDCSGHTMPNRLLAFARRAAPIQIHAWGYATGTGIPAMDYFLADSVLIPPEARGWFRETIVDMPSVVGYTHRWMLAGIEPPPLGPERTGPFTFGCFNRAAKINRMTLSLWARVLREVPGSRLLLKAGDMDRAEVRERITNGLTAEGIEPDRIAFEGGTPVLEHLARYQALDLSLDPYPHTGGVSSLDSLMMGVPVVSLTGGGPVSRNTASWYRTLGVDGFFVATTPDDYVRLAVEWAGRRDDLQRFRQELRDLFLGSFFMGPRYAASVEWALREVWRAWCSVGGDPAEVRRRFHAPAPPVAV